MTREEQIIQASEIFSTNDLLSFGGACEELDYGFREGAKWADKNPINVWHDASEEPVKDTHILIENSFFEDDLDYYSCHWSTSICPSWEEYVKEYNIKRWAYLSDLVDL